MKAFLYKARRSLLSCFLLTTAIGFCYAFSLFAPHAAARLGCSKTAVQFAFCLNIFFLGTGASCFGALVERNIKKAAWLSTALLFAGLCVSGLAMKAGSLWAFYLGMGVLCGLSEGVGYVTPVKNLLLFFGRSGHKALVTAISIVSFGLGSSICSFLFKYAYPAFGIDGVFFFYAGFYLLTTSVASLCIDKPRFAKIAAAKAGPGRRFSVAKYVRDPYFCQCWLFMFLNISMGLIIIGQCAGMLASGGLSPAAVVFVMMLCGLSNGAGRLVFPAVSDYMGKRIDVLLLALGLEIAALAAAMADPRLTPAAFVLVNACYGAFFASLPAILSDHYGNSELSFVHGLCLQSWASASLFAFLTSTFALGVLDFSQNGLFAVLAAVYALNFVNVLSMRGR